MKRYLSAAFLLFLVLAISQVVPVAAIDGGLGTIQPSSGTVSYTELGTYFTTQTDDGNCGSADTIDFTVTSAHKSTLSAATCTYTFTDPAGTAHVTLLVCQDGTGSRLVTWPASIKWSGGSAPTLTTTASKCDVFSAYWDGTNYYPSMSLNH